MTTRAETDRPENDAPRAEYKDNESVKENPEAAPTEAANPQDELAALQQELEQAKAKAAEHLDGWQRAVADMANYKKRTERERAESYQVTTAAAIGRLLPVLDDLDRAIREAPEGLQAPEIKRWFEGITLIQRKLNNLLDQEGVARIQAEGAMFDPNWHEAITHDESADHQEGQVIEVVRQGYQMGDRVLRPALVRVAK